MKRGFKLCPYCGKEIKSKALKCQYCLKFLEEEKEEKQCPFCLNMVDKKGRICPFCDEPFIDDENICISVNVADYEAEFCRNERPKTEYNINGGQTTILQEDADFGERFVSKNKTIKEEAETQEENDPNYVYKVLFVLLGILGGSFLLIMLMVRIFS